MKRPVKVTADHNVDVAPSEVFDLLRRGQPVETPLGPGVVHDIGLQAAPYGKRIELEPPAITVRLDDPEEDQPQDVMVCMCKLGLEDKQHEAIIGKEFSRLWPPLTNEVAEDTHMLVDLDNKTTEEVRARFEEAVANVSRVASTGARYRQQRQLYADFVRLALDSGEAIIDEAGELDEGTVLEGLEGVNLGDGHAVVLQSLTLDEEDESKRAYLVLYSPDKDVLQQVSVPEENNFMGYDGGESSGFLPTVYDPAALDSPELHPIRILPNTYLPRNPNYPSTITDTVWRPTVRQTPIRFYETREAAYPTQPGYEHDTLGHGNPPYVNFPSPDTLMPEEKSNGEPNPQYKPHKVGPQAYDPAEQPLDVEPYEDKKMQELFEEFWTAYQLDRESKPMGKPGLMNMHLCTFMIPFAKAQGWEKDGKFDVEEPLKLLNYMVQIGVIDKSLPEYFLTRYQRYLTGVDFRTQFTDD